MNWQSTLIETISNELKQDSQWFRLINEFKKGKSNRNIHLAIFTEPFLSYIFDGKKVLESRFSQKNRMPHGNISKGDIVVVKKTGGAIEGVFEAGNVISYKHLTPEKLDEIKQKYSNDICSNSDPDFWTYRSKAKYATLVQVKKHKRINPFKIEKRDRRAWVVLNGNSPQMKIPLR